MVEINKGQAVRLLETVETVQSQIARRLISFLQDHYLLQWAEKRVIADAPVRSFLKTDSHPCGTDEGDLCVGDGDQIAIARVEAPRV